MRRVVITGLGLITPLGNSVPDTWSALLRGQSGMGPITKFDIEKFSVKFAAEIKNFDPLNYAEKKEARKMGPFTQYAIAASDEAVKGSGLKIDESAEVRLRTPQPFAARPSAVQIGPFPNFLLDEWPVQQNNRGPTDESRELRHLRK